MNALKDYRKKAGLTQPELAEKVGISHRTLQDYEQGQKPLEGARAITVLKMARTLGCTVEDLIDPDVAEYTRAVPEKQEDLEVQRNEIVAYARQRGYKIIGQYAAEQSGGDSTPLIDRERREAVQAEIRRAHPDAIIITKENNQ